MDTEHSVLDVRKGHRPPLSVGVVGAGPAGLAVARALLRRSSHVTIALFDPALADPLLRGRGTPYRPDPARPLLNAPLHHMSVDPDDADQCTTWFASDPRAEGDTTYGSLTRPDFGRYLEAFLDDLPSYVGAHQTLALHPVEVTAIRPSEGGHMLLSPRCELGRFDVAVLCTGWGTVRPEAGEHGTVQHAIDHVLHRPDVAIRGTGLTAVDHARALLVESPSTRVVMTSRRGLLPGVRPAPLPEDDWSPLVATVDEPELGTVRALADHVLAEARRRGLASDPISERVVQAPRPVPWLEDGLEHVHAPSWRNLAVPVSEELLPRAWHRWDRPQRRVFLRRFHPHVQSWCNPMPPSTARLLLGAMQEGRLVVRAGASSPSGRSRDTIDATRSGFQSSAPLDTPLVRCLVNSGLAVRDPFGGLVTTPGHRVVGPSGTAALFAVGALTQGAHYVVNALDVVVRQAARTADEISQGACR